MRGWIVAGILCVFVTTAAAGPSMEYIQEYESAILESAAVVIAEVVREPADVPIERTQSGFQIVPASVELRALETLAGEGPAAGSALHLTIVPPPYAPGVGGPPTDEDRAAHRATWLSIFRTGTRWIFSLERSDTPQGPVWQYRRAYDAEGPGRADLDRLLKRRQDTEAIIALLIELPEMKPYWHAEEVPGRSPLILLCNACTPRSLRLTKFGVPVRVLDHQQRTDAKAEAYLEISELTIHGDTAQARMQYAVEGVVVEAGFARKDGTWTVTQAKAVER